LELGFATDRVRPVVAVPKKTLGETEIVGLLVPDATVGAASGTRKSIPETASSAMRSPELNFLKYTFVGVFNIFRRCGLKSIFKHRGRIVHFRGKFGRVGADFIVKSRVPSRN
jgi:hypothetical protein